VFMFVYTQMQFICDNWDLPVTPATTFCPNFLLKDVLHKL